MCCAFPNGKTGTKNRRATDRELGRVGRRLLLKARGHAQLWSSKKESSKRGRKRRLTEERGAYAHTQKRRIPSVTKRVSISSDSRLQWTRSRQSTTIVDRWTDVWWLDWDLFHWVPVLCQPPWLEQLHWRLAQFYLFIIKSGEVYMSLGLWFGFKIIKLRTM